MGPARPALDAVTLHLRLYFGTAALLYALAAVGILVVTVWLNGVSMGDYGAPFRSPDKVRDLVIFAVGLSMPLIPCALGWLLAPRRTGWSRYALIASILGAMFALPIPHLVLGPLLILHVLRGESES